MENYREIAEDFLNEGYAPVPLSEDKRPILNSDQHPYLYKPLTDLSYFDKARKIGISCGDVSGGFYCIDFDSHNKEPIIEKFNMFMADEVVINLLEECKLSIYVTPSGGYHIYIRCKEVSYSKTVLAYWITKASMVDFIGNGGYACVSPSPGYNLKDTLSLLEIEFCDAHEINHLIALCQSFTEATYETTGLTDHGFRFPAMHPRNTYIGMFNHNKVNRAKESLIKHGWELTQTRYDKTEYWRRPGKDSGISATWLPKLGLFFVFSSAADPFEQRVAYTPFEIVTILDYHGDTVSARTYVRNIFRIDLPEDPEYLPFPIEAFPDSMVYIIDQLRDKMNFAPDFTAAAMIFATSAIIGNSHKLVVKRNYFAPLIFWLVGVGVSGSKKSHPFNLIIKPIDNIDKELHYDYNLEYDRWSALKDQNKQPPPRLIQHIVKDSTIEALHMLHESNPRGLGLHKDEIIGFFKEFNRYKSGGSDLEFHLEAYNNNSFTVNRVTRKSLRVNNIHIPIAGTIQPDRLRGLDKAMFENGFINRFLFTKPDLEIPYESFDDVDEMVMAQWDQIISHLHNTCRYSDEKDTNYVEFSEKGRKEYYKNDCFYVDLKNDEDTPQMLSEYLSKIRTYLPRFSLLLATLDNRIEGRELMVTEEHSKRAFKICEYFRASATVIFNDINKKNELDRVTSSIEKKGVDNKKAIIELYKQGFKQTEIAEKFKISQSNVSKIIRLNK